MFSYRPTPKILPLVVVLILTSYQLIRVVAFINVYGGLEHDGGWMLSISRSLAEQGTYTTMVSTIVDPTVPGGINVDQKFDIQAPDGRIWFFTGNGIGPASIVPDALVLRIFGTGFWTLHLGPLIFYTLFLLLAAYILYRLAGLGGVILFHAFLFFYPHLSIFLSYEAMGEVPSMFYILWAYLAFASATKKQSPRKWHFFLAGLVVGLTLNAKLITLWSLSGIFIWAGLLWLAGIKKQLEKMAPLPPRFGELLTWGSGAILPPVLWEIVHLIILTRLTNFTLYQRQAQQRLQFILDDGSGVGLRTHTGPEFFWDKFFLLEEVAHPQRWGTAIIFTAIFFGGLILLWFWRSQSQKQNLLAPMWLGWLANTIWFVSLAKTGWVRHFWFGLILAVMLLCVIVVISIKYGFDAIKQRSMAKMGSGIHSGFLRWLPLAAGILLFILIGWGFIGQPHVWSFFLPDELVSYWQEKQINNKYGASLPWIIIPRVAQAEIVEYLQQLPPEAHIYYPAHHKTAELTAQAGRIFYPLNRRPLMQPHPQDVAIIGPSLTAPWMDPIRREALRQLVKEDCPHPLLANSYYMICPFPAE